MDRPKFRPFSEEEAVLVYNRNLPHWRQEGGTYFITFRLADALPKALLEQWDNEKRLWLQARTIDYNPKSRLWHHAFKKLPAKEQFQFNQAFNRKLNTELDHGRGACHFNQADCLSILREKLLQHDGKDYHLGDFIIMPNHVHLLINLIRGLDLDRPMKFIKGGSAFLLNQALERQGKLWQSESYDHLVRDAAELEAFRRYIRENPKKAGITLPPESYYHAEWLS